MQSLPSPQSDSPAPAMPAQPPVPTPHPKTRKSKVSTIRQSAIRCLQTPTATLSPDALQFSLNQIYYDQSLRDTRGGNGEAQAELPQIRVLTDNMRLLAHDSNTHTTPILTLLPVYGHYTPYLFIPTIISTFCIAYPHPALRQHYNDTDDPTFQLPTDIPTYIQIELDKAGFPKCTSTH